MTIPTKPVDGGRKRRRRRRVVVFRLLPLVVVGLVCSVSGVEALPLPFDHRRVQAQTTVATERRTMKERPNLKPRIPKGQQPPEGDDDEETGGGGAAGFGGNGTSTATPSSLPTVAPVLATDLPSSSPMMVATTDAPSEAPSSLPVVVVPDVSTMPPTPTPSASPPVVLPSPVPTQALPTVGTADPVTAIPSHVPSLDPSTALPSYLPSLGPSTALPTAPPSSEPSPRPTMPETAAPVTDLPSHVPSLVVDTTTTPSGAPISDAPSRVPILEAATSSHAPAIDLLGNDVPTSAPVSSLFPSLLPTVPPTASPHGDISVSTTDAPSAAEEEKDVVQAGQEEDGRYARQSCGAEESSSSPPATSDETLWYPASLAYSYQLAVAGDYAVDRVVDAIEDRLMDMMQEYFCNSSNITAGRRLVVAKVVFSSAPADQVSNDQSCEGVDWEEETCYKVDGGLTIWTAGDEEKSAQMVLCEIAERIHVLATTDAVTKVAGVGRVDFDAITGCDKISGGPNWEISYVVAGGIAFAMLAVAIFWRQHRVMEADQADDKPKVRMLDLTLTESTITSAGGGGFPLASRCADSQYSTSRLWNPSASFGGGAFSESRGRDEDVSFDQISSRSQETDWYEAEGSGYEEEGYYEDGRFPTAPLTFADSQECTLIDSKLLSLPINTIPESAVVVGTPDEAEDEDWDVSVDGDHIYGTYGDGEL